MYVFIFYLSAPTYIDPRLISSLTTNTNQQQVPFGLATVSVYLGHGSDGAGKGAAEADAIGISAFTDGDAIENTYNGVMVTK